MLHPAIRTAVCLVAFVPAVAWAEERSAVSVPAATLDEAIFILARQTGGNIGIRHQQLNRLPTRAVRGKLTTREALESLLHNLPAHVQRAGPNSWVIVAGARRTAPKPVKAKSAPPAPPPPLPTVPEPEIVVTASKRSIRLDDLPGTATIVSGDALTSLTDGANGTGLTARSVSLTSTHFGAGRNKLFVRGISDSPFSGSTQATVAQYLGEYRIVYSSPDPDLRMHDLKRIEILEGPQGTLHGAGSMGGLIRYVPLSPDPDAISGRLAATVTATQNGSPGGEILGAVNLPVVAGRVGLRGNAYVAREGGYIDAVNRGKADVNSSRTMGGRLSTFVALTDDLSLEASIAAQKIDSLDSQYANHPVRRLARVDDMAQPYTSRFALAGVVLKGQIGSFDATASFSHSAHRTAETFETTVFSTPFFQFENTVSATAIRRKSSVELERRSNLDSGEIRISRSSSDGGGLVVGLSYLSNESRTTQRLGLLNATDYVAGIGNDYREWTVFGETALAIRPWLLATLGGRLSAIRAIGKRDEEYLVFSSDSVLAEATREQWTAAPSGSLLLKPSETLTAYVRYSEGYRPGAIALASVRSSVFTGDRIHTTEMGLRLGKGGVDHWSLQLSLSQSLWTDIQADVSQDIGLPQTINIGDGTIKSAQARVVYSPNPGFSVDGAVLLNHSRLNEPSLTLQASEAFRTFVAKGRSNLPNVAKLSVRAGFQLSGSFGGGWEWDVDGMARYTGRSRLGIGSRYDKLQGGFIQTNLVMRMRRNNVGNNPGSHLALSVAITNLTNDAHSRFGIGNPFADDIVNQYVPQRPRSISLGFDIGF